MNDSFLFFILSDNTIRRFPIEQDTLNEIVAMLVGCRAGFLRDEIDQILFNGQYKPREDEILYVELPLPDSFQNIPNNTLEIDLLNLPDDTVKVLGLYHHGDYYFQCFQNHFITKAGRIALICSRNTYRQLQDPYAFTVEKNIHAIHHDGKLFFRSFTFAKQIFNLSSFFQEATNADIDTTFGLEMFSGTDCEWLKNYADVTMRKQITQLKNSQILDKINVTSKSFKSSAKLVGIDNSVYTTGHIVLPKNKKKCKTVLAFLNEDIFEGTFSKDVYISNSKRKK